MSDKCKQTEVAVPEIIEAVADFVGSQEGGPFTPAAIKAAILGQLEYGDEFKKLFTPPHPQPAPAVQGEPVAWIRKWSLDGEKPTKERNKNGRMAYPMKYNLHEVTRNRCLSDDVALYTAPKPAEQQSAPVFHDEDHVSIPRGLITAACSAIDKKRDGTKTLAELRRYTFGDLSKQPAPGALVEALEAIVSHHDEYFRDSSVESKMPWIKQARSALAAYRKQGGEA